MQQETFRLFIPDHFTFDQVMEARNKGGKFVFFTYLIPRPLFYPIRRISKIYFLRPSDNVSIYNKKYNLITLFWGWWGLPFGPSYTYATIKSNRTGVDMTEDVYDNLIKEDFEKGKVIINKPSTIYIHPNKSVLKEFKKCFSRFIQKNDSFTEDPIVGYYIDIEEPYYIIGLHSSDLNKSESLRNELYKYFFTKTKFEFIDINEGTERAEKLKPQGVKLSEF